MPPVLANETIYSPTCLALRLGVYWRSLWDSFGALDAGSLPQSTSARRSVCAAGRGWVDPGQRTELATLTLALESGSDSPRGGESWEVRLLFWLWQHCRLDVQTICFKVSLSLMWLKILEVFTQQHIEVGSYISVCLTLFVQNEVNVNRLLYVPVCGPLSAARS